MTQRYELRVLKGIHREARCAVHNGATVGSNTACDIVLSDDGIAPNAGYIHLHSEGWSIDTDEAQSDQASTIIPWNRAARLGEAWITVATEETPWIFTIPTEVSENTDSHLLPSDVASTSLSVDMETPTPQLSPSTRARQRSWPTMVVIAALAMVILSAITLAAVSSGSYSSTSSSTPAPAEQPLGQISAALQRLGLASSLHVTLSKAGTVTVSGWVRDREQYEAVASAMSQIWPMPAIRISLESDAIMTARAVLQRFSVKYDPLYQGNGRLEIVGVASSARERATALDAVRTQLPGLTVLGNTIELAQEVGDKLAEKLNGLGVSGVTLTWHPGHLAVQPPELDDAQETLLENTIADFNNQYWNIAQLGDEPAATTADSVPFQIRSVIGGPQPFIVLADGSKLLIGGTYKRYQLMAIEDSRIIFDGPRRAIVTR